MHVQSIEWQNEVEWKKEVSFSELYPIHTVWVATSLVFRRYSLSLSLNSECFAKCAVCCLIGNDKENNNNVRYCIYIFPLSVPARHTYLVYSL